jgi:hypothetical protein
MGNCIIVVRTNDIVNNIYQDPWVNTTFEDLMADMTFERERECERERKRIYKLDHMPRRRCKYIPTLTCIYEHEEESPKPYRPYRRILFT